MRPALSPLLLLMACAQGPGPVAGDAGAPDSAATGDVPVLLDSGTADPPTPDATAPDAANLDAASPDAGGPADAAPRDPLAGASPAELVRGGFQFLEGPVWRAGESRLLFTDIPADTIFALTPPGDITVFRQPSGRANGLANGPGGSLLAAEHEARRVSETLSDGSVLTRAELFEGHRLNSPNDLAVRRSDGTIYFTDPPWGLDGRPAELDFHGVFRLSPGGALSAEWRAPLDVFPNGVVLSEDAQRLYVADDHAAMVLVFDVAPDGTLSGRRPFAGTGPTPDGMTVDADGNVYVATSRGVEIFAPGGRPWGVLPVPEPPANCTFGGDPRTTLYVTARTGLYRIQLAVAGGD